MADQQFSGKILPETIQYGGYENGVKGRGNDHMSTCPHDHLEMIRNEIWYYSYKTDMRPTKMRRAT